MATWVTSSAITVNVVWKTVEAVFRNPKDADITSINLKVVAKNAPSKAYVDNIRFFEKTIQECCAFIELPDTPNSYEGMAGRVPIVNDSESGLMFIDLPSTEVELADLSAEVDLLQEMVLPAGASRPDTALIGAHMFDTTLGKPIWYNGEAWVDATGIIV
jgi:hypothetical protein